MVNIERLKKLVNQYDLHTKVVRPDYSKIRTRLCTLVDKHGFEAVAIASGLGKNTVKQHYRNVSGSSMISESRLDKADAIFKLYKSGEE